MAEVVEVVRESKLLRGILSVAIGVGIGIVLETNTDEVARGKITTVETCEKIYPLDQTITPQFDHCIEKGVPNGDPVGNDKLKVGDPSAYVDSYVQAQKSEQGLEPVRLMLWGIVGSSFELSEFIF